VLSSEPASFKDAGCGFRLAVCDPAKKKATKKK
jgi:hypothetical protein